MSEGIILLAEENLWTKFLSRQTNKHVHWILQVGSAVFSITGVTVLYLDRKKHFKSTHSTIGIISVSFIFLILLLGVLAFFSARLRQFVRPVILKFLHNFLGIFCFVMGMVAMIYGLEKRWMKRHSSAEKAEACIIFTYIITVFSLVGALRSLFNQAVSLIR